MAIVNRDKDVSEQKECMAWKSQAQVSTGATLFMEPLPYPAVFQSVAVAAIGLSGSPQIDFFALRFAGGQTSIPLSISNMVVSAFGTSGTIGAGYSGLQATGSTLLILQQGDVIGFHTSVANTAAAQLMLNMVIKKTQDIVSCNGYST